MAVGTGISDLFSGIGELASAGAYKQAAKYAEQNAVIAREAGDIKLEQTGRQVYKVLGQQGAGYAGAGLTESGSAQSILRDSIHQGALEKAIVNEQAQINVTGYKAQAAQFSGMATAATAGGIGSIVSGIFGIFSDRRLKTDVEQIGTFGKLGIYTYRFLWEDRLRTGVMADEVALHAPHALGPIIEGYATVDYDKLGLSHLVEG